MSANPTKKPEIRRLLRFLTYRAKMAVPVSVEVSIQDSDIHGPKRIAIFISPQHFKPLEKSSEYHLHAPTCFLFLLACLQLIHTPLLAASSVPLANWRQVLA